MTDQMMRSLGLTELPELWTPEKGITTVPPWLGPVLAEHEDPGLAALRRAASTKSMAAVDKPRESAVLVLVEGDPTATERPEDARIVLTHRSPNLRSHAGQMAFPGGKVDATDRDAVHTALREAWEETGLNPVSATPLRVIDSIGIDRTGFEVHPVLAYWHDPHELRVVDENETDAVLTVPVSELISPESRFTAGFGDWSGPAFRVGEFVVWGFTAGVLSHLLDAAGWSVPWEQEPVHDLFDTLAKSANNESFNFGGSGTLR